MHDVLLEGLRAKFKYDEIALDQTMTPSLFVKWLYSFFAGWWSTAAEIIQIKPTEKNMLDDEQRAISHAPLPPKGSRKAQRNSRIIAEDELQKHRSRSDAWIAVDGLVFDITPHLVNHPGWRTAGQVSTVMAIMDTLGRDCSVEFHEIMNHHTPAVQAEMRAYMIGKLEPSQNSEQSAGLTLCG